MLVADIFFFSHIVLKHFLSRVVKVGILWQRDNEPKGESVATDCSRLKRQFQIFQRSFLKQVHVFTCLLFKSLENNVSKGEIACKEQFLLFLQTFPFIKRNFRHFYLILNCHLQTLSVW